MIKQNNEKYISRKLIEYNDYFDKIFTEAGENIRLDVEQRKIILRDDGYALINVASCLKIPKTICYFVLHIDMDKN